MENRDTSLEGPILRLSCHITRINKSYQITIINKSTPLCFVEVYRWTVLETASMSTAPPLQLLQLPLALLRPTRMSMLALDLNVFVGRVLPLQTVSPAPRWLLLCLGPHPLRRSSRVLHLEQRFQSVLHYEDLGRALNLGSQIDLTDSFSNIIHPPTIFFCTRLHKVAPWPSSTWPPCFTSGRKDMISRSLSTPGDVFAINDGMSRSLDTKRLNMAKSLNPTSYERVMGTFAPNVARKTLLFMNNWMQLIFLSGSFLAILKPTCNRNRSLEDKFSIQRDHFQVPCLFCSRIFVDTPQLSSGSIPNLQWLPENVHLPWSHKSKVSNDRLDRQPYFSHKSHVPKSINPPNSFILKISQDVQI